MYELDDLRVGRKYHEKRAITIHDLFSLPCSMGHK